MPYGDGSEKTGIIAVLGPIRLDYGRIIANLEYFSKRLDQLMTAGE